MSAVLAHFDDRLTAFAMADGDRQYRAIFDAVHDCILVSDPATGLVIDINRAGCQMFGYAKDELVGRDANTFSSGIEPYTWEAGAERYERARSGEAQTFEWQCRAKGGRMFWTEVSMHLAPFGPSQAILVSVRDITDRKQQHERFRQLADNVAEVFWMSNPDKTEMLYVSPGYEPVWGRSCRSLYETPRQWIEAIHEEDRERILQLADRQVDIDYNEEYRIVRPDGDVRWIRDRAFPVRDEDGTVYCIAGVACDITERKRLDARIAYMAHHDALTGLANRATFTATLKRAIFHAQRSGSSLAILFLDLDNFKDINAVRGHLLGDKLVRLVAERLELDTRFNETAFRLGGDAFAILLSDSGEPSELGAVAERLIATVSKPFVIDGSQIQVGASVGIAIAGDNACDADTLMSHAETALYRAKAEGRQTYRFCSPAMDNDARSRIALTEELRVAIPAGQLFVVYQPQVRTRDGHIVGVEALVRWTHPTRGVLTPGSFLPMAESSGLIVALDRWVLRQACRQARQWIDAGLTPGTMCVNISSAQFKDPLDLEKYVLAVLEETGLPAKLLELEITESTFIGFSSEHRKSIQRLRSAGIRFSLDDFGTGFSSLNYLRRFSVDRIKIAQEFIVDLASSNDAAAIVRCILNLARDLGNEVIAEGVETAEQLKVLREWDCPDIQGFYFAAPMTAAALLPLLSAGAIVRSPAS